MIKYIIVAILMALWAYLLHVLKKTKLSFWHFVVGSAGLFVFLMFVVMPVVTVPLSRTVAAVSGVIGRLLGFYEAYYKYSVIFIDAGSESLTLAIDFECSGVIEIFAFLSLLTFFNVYKTSEKMMVGAMGTLYLLMANVIRVTFICVIIHFFGGSAYYVAHTYLGRILFYALSVGLYFYVFTKEQIVRQKVGGFSYDRDK